MKIPGGTISAPSFDSCLILPLPRRMNWIGIRWAALSRWTGPESIAYAAVSPEWALFSRGGFDEPWRLVADKSQ
jgi:hypothetical protein